MRDRMEKLEARLEATGQKDQSLLSQDHTIREAYRWASSFLRDQGITDPLFEVEWMLREFLELDRASFFMMWNKIMTNEQLIEWKKWVEQRGHHVPLQYIFGKAHFYGRSFQVTPSVLIPRPETELLVEHVLQVAEELFGNHPLNVVEVGTGSGCIAITMQLERPKWSITTIDLSVEALDVAKLNADLHGVRKQIHFRHGSYLEPIKEEAIDLIISNPPYIPSTVIPSLDTEVQAYEPHLALNGGIDGIHPYRIMTQQIASLAPVAKRLIAFEIGAEQGEQVAELMREISGCSWVEIRQDLAGRDRYVLGFCE